MAHFDEGICQDCPLVQICPAQKGRRDTSWHLRFTEAQVHVSQRRRRNQKNEDDAHNLRAAVEATIYTKKIPGGPGGIRTLDLFSVIDINAGI
ncbi:MAG: hypothetical protein WAM09_11420 [Anaerolineales bacterium]